MGSRSLPLLCPVTLSLRTLILYTRPYSENILVSSASSMDLGICPTNILMKSGSGCSGRLMLLKQAGNKEINRLWVQCLRVLGENHASKIRHPQDDKSESKFKVETLNMDTWRGTDHFMWASIKSLQSLHHHETPPRDRYLFVSYRLTDTELLLLPWLCCHWSLVLRENTNCSFFSEV